MCLAWLLDHSKGYLVSLGNGESAARRAKSEEKGGLEEIQGSFDPDILYNQGMAYYRRRHWREATRCFERVKVLQPNYRGIDALLRELAIFLQLESVGTGPSTEAVAPREMETTAEELLAEEERQRELEAAEEEEEDTHRGGGWWIWLVVLLVTVLVVGLVLWISMGLPPFDRDGSEKSLRIRCRSNTVAQNWCPALDACSKLATRLPEDLEARNRVEKSKLALYNEGTAYMGANDIPNALKNFTCIVKYDPEYKDVAELIEELKRRQELDGLYREARGYLESRAYGEAIKKLLEIRGLDAEYRPGTISDDLYEAYLGRALRNIDLAAAELQRAVNAKPAEPLYAVTDGILEKIRSAIRDFDKALGERPGNQDAQLAKFLAENVNEGLERYSEWGWQESIVALSEIYDREPFYFMGKAVAVLCDAHLHLGDFYRQNEDWLAAWHEYQAMRDIEDCDQGVVRTRLQEVSPYLTPTAMPTLTPTPTPTARPTNTRRPTLVPTMTPAPTVTPTPVPTTSPPQSGGNNGGSKPKPTSKPPQPTPRPTKKPRN